MTEETKNAATRDASPLLPSAKHRRELSALAAQLQVAEAQRDGLLEAAMMALDRVTEHGYGTKDAHLVLHHDAYHALEKACGACTRSEG